MNHDEDCPMVNETSCPCCVECTCEPDAMLHSTECPTLYVHACSVSPHATFTAGAWRWS